MQHAVGVRHELGALLDGLVRGARATAGLAVAIACGFLAATVAFGHGGPIHAEQALAGTTSGQSITTPDEAVQWLAGSSSALGTTPGQATLAGALPADAAGALGSAPIFRVGMRDGSSCLVLLTGLTSCGASPDGGRPVVGVVADVDGADGPLPFVAVADVSDAVTGVTFTCAGGTVTATVENGLMTLVAPAGLGDPGACTERATLTDGGTWDWSFSR